jgi:hypothetical protein
MVLVSEEPGVGLGARFAGLDGIDPGDFTDRPPAGKVHADGHPTALWQVEPDPGDRAAFVGEAWGMWLWAVLWPASAGLLLLEDLNLADVRRAGPAAYEMLGYGTESPRMAPPRLEDLPD